VVVANGAGETNSANALLTVNSPALAQIASPVSRNGNQIEFTISGDPQTSVTVWRSEDLDDWVPVTNLWNLTGTIIYSEAVDTNAPQRYYRVAWP
jgi:hypothetical protein